MISITSSGTYNALDQQTILIKADNVTVQLPAPSLNYMVKVKVDGTRANAIVNAIAGIDGFGANYPLDTDYQAGSFISDGTKWYII